MCLSVCLSFFEDGVIGSVAFLHKVTQISMAGNAPRWIARVVHSSTSQTLRVLPLFIGVKLVLTTNVGVTNSRLLIPK